METKTTKNGYNISTHGFTGLDKFIKQKYNTGEKVGIYENIEGSHFLNMFYEGAINFELQRCGTITQQKSYLNLKIKEFVKEIKNKHEAESLYLKNIKKINTNY
jgi:hypothetical protein